MRQGAYGATFPPSLSSPIFLTPRRQYDCFQQIQNDTRDRFHPLPFYIYIYISLGTLLEFLEALWISPIFKRFSN